MASRLTRRAGEIVACEEADAALPHGIDGQRESTTGGLKPDEDYYRATNSNHHAARFLVCYLPASIAETVAPNGSVWNRVREFKI